MKYDLANLMNARVEFEKELLLLQLKKQQKEQLERTQKKQDFTDGLKATFIMTILLLIGAWVEGNL